MFILFPYTPDQTWYSLAYDKTGIALSYEEESMHHLCAIFGTVAIASHLQSHLSQREKKSLAMLGLQTATSSTLRVCLVLPFWNFERESFHIWNIKHRLII